MRNRQTMNVSITPELAAFAAARLASERYKNASLFCAALRLLADAEARLSTRLLKPADDAALHGR